VPAKKRFSIVISLKLRSNSLIRLIVVVAIISSLLVPRGYCQETEDSQTFISGFNAYQQKNYPSTIEKMTEVLTRYPDTPLRDMALFWLSRAYFKNGNQRDAARYMSQFSKEYPDNPLKSTVDEALLALTARYDKGENLPSGTLPTVSGDRQVVAVKEQDRKAEDQARLAAQKAELDRKASEQARIVAQKTEQERVAAAEAARVAAVRNEQERIAAARIEEERTAAAERTRLAASKAEQERAAVAAEAARVAELKAEQVRLAAQKAELERAVAAAETARQEASKKEQERILAQKAEQERIAAAEAARVAAGQKEQERKTEEQLKVVSEDQVAKQQAELVRLSMAKAEQKAAKLREAKAAEEAAEAVRQKAEAKRRTAEAAEQARLASVKAEEERIAQEKINLSQRSVEEAEQKKLAALKAEQQRTAAEQTDKLRAEREKAEQSRLAAVKAEEQRVAAALVEKERQAAAAAESARLASVKREQERLASEKAAVAAAESARMAAVQKEQERSAAASKEEKQPVVQLREDGEKSKVAKAALREKAIDQYKSIIEKYPNSKPAIAAAAKLKELGVSVAMPQQAAVAETLPENARVLNLQVAQYAGVELNLLSAPQPYAVGRRFSIPFELVNRGNGTDSFYLESGFPNEFAAVFASSSASDTPINQTTVLAPGESFKGVISLLMPASSIDGRRINHPVKVASRFLPEATQSREVAMTASAPLIRAVLKSDKNQPLPGEKITYRVAILNVGSAAAQDVSFRLNFPPQMEPADYAVAGFRQEMKAALVIDGLQIKSGESREFSLVFQVKEDSMAGQELLTRAELNNNLLKTTATFVSNATYVQQQRGIQVRAVAERLIVIPGQTVNVPFIVTNTGNGREKLKIASSVKSAQDTVIFHDLNRDGIRQATEPVITEIGPLAPKEEASVVMEIKIPRSAADGSEGAAQISFSPEGDAARAVTGATRLVYSRPVLDMAMSGGDGRLKPGEVASFDLTIINRGSNLARVVELQSAWPDKLDLVAADPGNSSITNGSILWKFKELGAGEKRTIKVSFRVKPGISMGTNIQVKNILTYEDQLGNRY
jgi:uncharacterized repeat protein (TIGR01451 family)